MTDSARPLVRMRNLSVSFPGQSGPAVRSVDLTVDAGTCVAIVGESGSGKSVTARSLLGLAGAGAVVRADTLEFDGRDLLTLDDKDWRSLRGRRIGYVLQDALTSLDPLRRVGDEVAETLEIHGRPTADELDDRVVELLREVGIPDPDSRMFQYPHELSGGLRQRVLIASALAGDPSLLIADEPTTALDVTIQGQIVDLLRARRDAGTAVVLISHDLAVVSSIADVIVVMHDGVVVEQGSATSVLTAPRHPYTARLLASVPSLDGPFLPSSAASERAVIDIRAVTKRYALPDRTVRTAVDAVSLAVAPGESLGIVGESGSGKSTLAKLVMARFPPDEGSVHFDGTEWSSVRERQRRPLRRRLQMVDQDPLGSFDPRFTVERVLTEALRPASGRGPTTAAVARLLASVDLTSELATRYPSQLSGGQRQRVAIARALACEPEVIVADEPVSALDVTVQAQILTLFADLRERTGTALVFVSHDLAVIARICSRVAVLKDGVVVELGDTADVFRSPTNPYTKSLLGAVPTLPSPSLTHRSRSL
ncbi:dipeptide ABC transporter ATP-binding protein [Rhodococcus baikonurensis]|uniref:dipeptide ABC transporter ATP-binding protein n=1 Tax=Rhodococcus baikonurensis TaxID=172041 RepID=UPI00378D4C64